MIEVVPAILGNATDRDERDPRPDYAARRRNAIQDASGHVLVSRERATGAAAESEQLLTAVRIVLGRTDNYISCFCPGPCCHQLSERLADWPIGDWTISFPPNRIGAPGHGGKTREATVGDNQNSMTAGPWSLADGGQPVAREAGTSEPGILAMRFIVVLDCGGIAIDWQRLSVNLLRVGAEQGGAQCLPNTMIGRLLGRSARSFSSHSN